MNLQEFQFVKKVDLELLKRELSLSKISEIIENCSFENNITKITCKRFMSPAEISTLHSLITNHKAATDAELYTKARISDAISFGQSIILEFATENVIMKLSTEQVGYVLYKFSNIKSMLESGSLHTALAAMEAIKPDAIISKERIDKYSNKIKEYLKNGR